MQMISMEIFHMLNSLISILCNEKLNKIYTNFFLFHVPMSLSWIHVILLTLSRIEERGMPYLCTHNCQNPLMLY